MEAIIIHTKGQNISPSTYDIKHTIDLLKHVNKSLRPLLKNDEIISYEQKEGSVIHKLLIPFAIVATINAELGNINNNNISKARNIMPLIEYIQNVAKTKGLYSTIKTTLNNSYSLKINKETNYTISEQWIKTDMYLHGEITNAGGKKTANIHIDTDDNRTIIAELSKDKLKSKNFLYNSYRVLIECEQNLTTQTIRNAKVIMLEPYKQEKDIEKYLNKKIKIAKKNWQDVNATEWLKSVR